MTTLLEVAHRLMATYGPETRCRIVADSLRTDLGNVAEVLVVDDLITAVQHAEIEGVVAVVHRLKLWEVVDAGMRVLIEPEIADRSPNQAHAPRALFSGRPKPELVEFRDGIIYYAEYKIAAKALSGGESKWQALATIQANLTIPFTRSDLQGVLDACFGVMEDPLAIVQEIRERLCSTGSEPICKVE